MPDPTSPDALLSSIPSLGLLIVLACTILLLSLWRSRQKARGRKKNSHLPWTVALSSLPPQSSSNQSSSRQGSANQGNGNQAAKESQQAPNQSTRLFDNFDPETTGQIASLSTKKAVFIVDEAPFAVGSRVYFNFDSSHLSGQFFCGQVSKIRQDRVTDQYRLTLNILDKPFSLSRSKLKKLMLPIAS